MLRLKSRLLIAMTTFVIGVLGVGMWIFEKQTSRDSVKGFKEIKIADSAQNLHNQATKINLPSQEWVKLVESEIHDTVEYSSVIFFNANNGLGLRPLSLEKTRDGGKNWERVLDYNKTNGFAYGGMTFTDNKNGWIVGMESTDYKYKNSDEFLEDKNSKGNKPLILKTDDRGATWRKIKLDEESLPTGDKRFSVFIEICVDKLGNSWIVGDGGIVGGKIERDVFKLSSFFPSEEVLGNIACSESGEAWAVGNGETVLHYKNGWTRIDLGNEAILKKDLGYTTSFSRVKQVDNEVWVVGYSRQRLVKSNEEPSFSGVLLRSRDNGQTWENKTPASADGLFDVLFEGKKGWLVGMKGTIFSTENGGESWLKHESPTENHLYGIFFLDSKNGWIAGDMGTILRYRK